MKIPKELYDADFLTIYKFYRKKSVILYIKSLLNKKWLAEYQRFQYEIWSILNPDYKF